MPIDLTLAQAIDGWMHDRELRWLAERARASQVIIEIGCYRGRSTRCLADHTSGVVYAIDPWSGPYLRDDGRKHKIDTDQFELFKTNLSDHIESGRVVPIQATADDAWPSLTSNFYNRHAFADLVFIDGDHRYESVVSDISNYRRLLKNGGILAGHDYRHKDWPGVKRAVDELFPHAQFCRTIWWVTV